MIRRPPKSTLFPNTPLSRSPLVDGTAPPSRGSMRVAASHARANALKMRSEEHTSELQSPMYLVCRLLLLKKALAAGAALLLTLENKNYFGNQGQGYLLTAIAAVLIGGSFFFNDTATTEIYTLSLHDALPI